jgi:hypothetical protein
MLKDTFSSFPEASEINMQPYFFPPPYLPEIGDTSASRQK